MDESRGIIIRRVSKRSHALSGVYRRSHVSSADARKGPGSLS